MSGLATQNVILQNAATGNGNGTVADVDGWNGAQMVRLVNTGSGTCTVTIEGSLSSIASANAGTATWHAAGYWRVDGQASLTRSASGFALGASGSGTDIVVLQVLDPYNCLRTRISNTSGTIAVTTKLYAAAA